jgi:DNA polymerase III delta prime subunit
MVDASQLAALEQVLTKEFAIVQGPPGTGKTYVGLQAARLMLENKSPKPILCVCYTNHALDQFLEGIYEFEKKIIRLGGRSKSELMREQCSLFSPHWTKSVDKSIMFQRYQLLDEVADLKNKILDAADKLSASYIGLSALDTVFHPEQVDTLLTGPGKNVHQSQVVRKWLEEDKKPQPNKTKPVKTNEKPGPIVKPEEVQTKSENVDDEEELDDEIDEDALGELLAEREDEEDTDLAQRQNKNAEAVFNVQQVEEVEDVLTEDQFSDLMNRVYKTNNLWDIDINARRKIHGFLLHEQRMKQKAEMKHLNEKYSSLCRKMKELNHVRTMTLLRQANVIGMTTTAAAKNVDLLSALKPKIVIVEEAAEVLEAHIITALTKDTQHLILIGDHQQLRPSTAVYALSKKYNLDVSLFERMTKNEVPYRKLLTQRRMRPEISQLVGPIYNKQLIDHPTVNGHPRIVRGVAKNVFFLDHTVPEQTVGDSTSKVNEHEVSLVANLCLYLVQQGYQSEKITVLTMYLQQLFRIKEQLKENNKIHDGCSSIRVSSVDNFQGEENDIIILSLVRSNNKKSIGFLKISNRVCVALSRARNAFYMIGNAQLLEQESPLWREVIQILRENDNIGPELKLCCQKHRSSTSLIKTGLDIREKAKDGGCSLPCDAKLACGHSCKLLCHPSDKHFCCESCQ